MGSLLSSPLKREDIEMALAKAKQIVSSNSVVLFRNPQFCPDWVVSNIAARHCGCSDRVKQLLSQLKATYKVIELDEESDGDALQSALLEWTGQRTVPNVFINCQHIGGCDAVLAEHQQVFVLFIDGVLIITTLCFFLMILGSNSASANILFLVQTRDEITMEDCTKTLQDVPIFLDWIGRLKRVKRALVYLVGLMANTPL